MRRALAAAAAALLASRAARADMVSEGERCVPVQLAVSGTKAFAGFDILLASGYVLSNKRESSITLSPLIEGQPMRPGERGPHALVALPSSQSARTGSKAELEAVGMREPTVIYHRLTTCFAKHLPGVSEVHRYQVMRVGDEVGARLMGAERLGPDGAVVARFRAVPLSYTVVPSDAPPDAPFWLVSGRGAADVKRVSTCTTFNVPPDGERSFITAFEPPPPPDDRARWASERIEKLDGLLLSANETELVDEGGPIVTATRQLVPSRHGDKASLRRGIAVGFDAAGNAHEIIGYEATRTEGGWASVCAAPRRSHVAPLAALSALLLGGGALALARRRLSSRRSRSL